MALSKIIQDSIADDAVTAAKIGSLPAGSVLQVKTAQGSTNTVSGSGTIAAANGMNISITAQSASSVLVVQVSGDIQQNSNGDTQLYLGRNKGSGMVNAINGQALAANNVAAWGYYYGGGANGTGNAVLHYSPIWYGTADQTTSQTFELYLGVTNGGPMTWGNHQITRMIVWEIAG